MRLHQVKRQTKIAKWNFIFWNYRLLIVGAIISNGFIEILGKRAILVSAILLILAFLVMFIDREESLLKKNKIK